MEFDESTDYKSDLNLKTQKAGVTMTFHTNPYFIDNTPRSFLSYQSVLHILDYTITGNPEKSKKLAEQQVAYKALCLIHDGTIKLSIRRSTDIDRDILFVPAKSVDTRSWKTVVVEFYAKWKLATPIYEILPYGTGFKCKITSVVNGSEITAQGGIFSSKKASEHDASYEFLHKLKKYYPEISSVLPDSQLMSSTTEYTAFANDKEDDDSDNDHDRDRDRVVIMKSLLPKPQHNHQTSVEKSNWKGKLLEISQSSHGQISRPVYTHSIASEGFKCMLSMTVDGEEEKFYSEVFRDKKSCEHNVSAKAIDFLQSLRHTIGYQVSSIASAVASEILMDDDDNNDNNNNNNNNNSKNVSSSSSSSKDDSKDGHIKDSLVSNTDMESWTLSSTQKIDDQNINWKGQLLNLSQVKSNSITDIDFQALPSLNGFTCVLNLFMYNQRYRFESGTFPKKKMCEQDASRKALELYATLNRNS